METKRDDEVIAGHEVNREKLGGVTTYHPYSVEHRASEGRCSDSDESLYTEDI